MDGIKDYKQMIDIDKDGRFDVIKYGIESGTDIIWYSTIQDFETRESMIDRKSENEARTKWFDIDDKAFAHYEVNVLKLIALFLCIPLLILIIFQVI